MVTGILVIVCIRTFQNGKINNLTSCRVWSLKLDNSVVIEYIKRSLEVLLLFWIYDF